MSLTPRIQVRGARGLISALDLLETDTRSRIFDAIKQTTREIERGAKSRAPASTSSRRSRKSKRRPGPGELRGTIRSELNEGTLVGQVMVGHGKLRRRVKGGSSKRKSSRKRAAKVKAARGALGAQRELGVYAMVVEYGSRRQVAQPFLRPTAQAQRPRHDTLLRRALREAANEAARRAGRDS